MVEYRIRVASNPASDWLSDQQVVVSSVTVEHLQQRISEVRNQYPDTTIILIALSEVVVQQIPPKKGESNDTE